MSDPPDTLTLQISKSTGRATLNGRALVKLKSDGKEVELEPKERAYLLTLAKRTILHNPLNHDEAVAFAENYWSIKHGMTPDECQKVCHSLFVPKQASAQGESHRLMTKISRSEIEKYFILTSERDADQSITTAELRASLGPVATAVNIAIRYCLPSLTQNPSAFDICPSKGKRGLSEKMQVEWID